jgi:hypothetical protein
MRIQLFTLMLIWIQLPETVWIHADPDPDPQPWVAPVNLFRYTTASNSKAMATFIFASLS